MSYDQKLVTVLELLSKEKTEQISKILKEIYEVVEIENTNCYNEKEQMFW